MQVTLIGFEYRKPTPDDQCYLVTTNNDDTFDALQKAKKRGIKARVLYNGDDIPTMKRVLAAEMTQVVRHAHPAAVV